MTKNEETYRLNQQEEIIRQSLPGVSLTAKEESAVRKVIGYIQEHGMATGYIPEKEERTVFRRLLGETLRRCCGKDFEEIMTHRRHPQDFLYRCFCFREYRRRFPTDSSRDIKIALNVPQNTSSIRRAMLKLDDTLQYNKKEADRYRQFKQTLDTITYLHSNANQTTNA